MLYASLQSSALRLAAERHRGLPGYPCLVNEMSIEITWELRTHVLRALLVVTRRRVQIYVFDLKRINRLPLCCLVDTIL